MFYESYLHFVRGGGGGECMITCLSHSDLPADLKRSRRSDTIEAAKRIDCSAVIDGNSSKGVTGLDGVPAHSLSFSILFPVILLILHLIIKVLLIIAVDAEVLLLKDKEPMAELALLEVNQPLRIECIALIPCLEVKMRTC